ncbi:Retrovirus-related Pol polyprotein from transposon TNT 1-94 [Senna tora]|uniref:Retrovirus-related Pol polyprotein from transposon TNT 1-94 n=1 Tax=Senna tora TaxID=362788 RepID=A0A834SUV9_9FABA|nr:Retrovirus-related Pol polyprotein from transposon TNT 1-94 [Senna tora]
MASNLATILPPSFNGEKYQIWVVKMKAHLQGLGLWQWVKGERELPALGNNPTLTQIRAREEEEAKAPRALSIIHSAISGTVFIRIMTCETATEAWEMLKKLYQGDERMRKMKAPTIKRDFATLEMNEKESIQQYSDRLMTLVNKIRLLGEDLPESKVVEKMFISLPEKFEAKFSSLEDSRDIDKLTLSELINVLQAQEQRRAMRREETQQVDEMLLYAKAIKGKGNIPSTTTARSLVMLKKIVGTKENLNATIAKDLDMYRKTAD